MSLDRIDKLCRSVLPPGFEDVRRRLPEIQRFIEQNLPQPVNGAVTLLTLDHDEIVIAASTPLVANYLRLHAREIQQQLRETFGLEQKLRFRSLPDSLLKPPKTEPVRRPPRVVDARSIEALRRNAEWIEDDSLREAILSLANSLRQDDS